MCWVSLNVWIDAAGDNLNFAFSMKPISYYEMHLSLWGSNLAHAAPQHFLRFANVQYLNFLQGDCKWLPERIHRKSNFFAEETLFLFAVF